MDTNSVKSRGQSLGNSVCNNRHVVANPQDITKTVERLEETKICGSLISSYDPSLDGKSLQVVRDVPGKSEVCNGKMIVNPKDINNTADTVQGAMNSDSTIPTCERLMDEKSLEIKGKFCEVPELCNNSHIFSNPKSINKTAEIVEEDLDRCSIISECACSVEEKSREIEGKFREDPVNSQDISRTDKAFQGDMNSGSVISECECSVNELSREIEGKFREVPVTSEDMSKTAETVREDMKSSSVISEFEYSVDEQSREIEGKSREETVNSQDINKTVVNAREAIDCSSAISECECTVDEKAPETTEIRICKVERKSNINKFITSIFKVPWQVNMGKDSKREIDNVVLAGRKGDGIKIVTSELETSTDCRKGVEDEQELDVNKYCEADSQGRDITAAENKVTETKTIESVDCSLCNREEQADVRTRSLSIGLHVQERAQKLVNSDLNASNNTQVDMKQEDSSERSLFNIGSTIKRFNPFGKLTNFNFPDVYSKIFKNIVLPKEVDNALALLFDREYDENVEDLDLESEAKALCLDPNLMDVSEFEDHVTKKMKEDGGLMYKNSDYEEILLKYDALPPALSLRKTTLKDESDCLEQKSEATPCSSV